MGYEIVLKFYDRAPDGDYDKSEVKEMKRKVGEPFEDVSLEVLAQRIMSQMARRDIFVLPDVEIYELKKQKVSFRETKGGVIIKNKKFILDSDQQLQGQEVLETPETSAVSTPVSLPSLPVPPALPGPRRPIKYVLVDDTGVVMDSQGNRVPVPLMIQRAGLHFRSQERYAVFQEMDDPRDKRVDKNGSPVLDRRKVFLMWDDRKREVTVSTDYFMPADVNLLADRELGFSTGSVSRSPKLLYDDEANVDMPDLRSTR